MSGSETWFQELLCTVQNIQPISTLRLIGIYVSTGVYALCNNKKKIQKCFLDFFSFSWTNMQKSLITISVSVHFENLFIANPHIILTYKGIPFAVIVIFPLIPSDSF